MTTDVTPAASQATIAAPLSVILKESTSSTHESLDQRIMRADPFADTERYRQFLKVQFSFHWLTAPLFAKQELEHWMPDLSKCCRLNQVTRDCADLGMEQNEIALLTNHQLPLDISHAEALGWLYTIEGSNIGGAFLFKFAKKLGFDENKGASHLAGNPEGRGRHWKTFKHNLDRIPLDDSDRAKAQAGAQAAFQFVREQVETFLP